MNNSLALLGRIGLSLIFIISGWAKIAGYAGTQQYMESAGVPGALLPLVIALEFGGGLAILAGMPDWVAAWVRAVPDTETRQVARFQTDCQDPPIRMPVASTSPPPSRI